MRLFTIISVICFLSFSHLQGAQPSETELENVRIKLLKSGWPTEAIILDAGFGERHLNEIKAVKWLLHSQEQGLPSISPGMRESLIKATDLTIELIQTAQATKLKKQQNSNELSPLFNALNESVQRNDFERFEMNFLKLLALIGTDFARDLKIGSFLIGENSDYSIYPSHNQTIVGLLTTRTFEQSGGPYMGRPPAEKPGIHIIHGKVSEIMYEQDFHGGHNDPTDSFIVHVKVLPGREKFITDKVRAEIQKVFDDLGRGTTSGLIDMALIPLLVLEKSTDRNLENLVRRVKETPPPRVGREMATLCEHVLSGLAAAQKQKP